MKILNDKKLLKNLEAAINYFENSGIEFPEFSNGAGWYGTEKKEINPISIMENTHEIENNLKGLGLTLSGSRLAGSPLVTPESDYDFFTCCKEVFEAAIKYLERVATFEISSFNGCYLYMGTTRLHKYRIINWAGDPVDFQVTLCDNILEEDVAIGISLLKKLDRRQVTFTENIYMKMLDILGGWRGSRKITIPPMAKYVVQVKGLDYWLNSYEFVYPDEFKKSKKS